MDMPPMVLYRWNIAQCKFINVINPQRRLEAGAEKVVHTAGAKSGQQYQTTRLDVKIYLRMWKHYKHWHLTYEIASHQSKF